MNFHFGHSEWPAGYGQHSRDEEIEEDIFGHDENELPSDSPFVRYRHSRPVYQDCQPNSARTDNVARVKSSDLADALAKRILAERDEAADKIRHHALEAQRLREERNGAEERIHNLERVAAQAMAERDECEQELSFAQTMLLDAAYKNERLRSRVKDLESCLQRVLDSAPLSAPPPPLEPEPSALGLKHTREAIERAVHEAAQLPEDERRKKLKALRLKWHPDKHEFLKEMAEEVTKIINDAIAKMEREKGKGGDGQSSKPSSP